MDNKSWWQSKTIWVNLIAIAGIVLNHFFGIELDAETQAVLATSVLAVINIILRIKTNQPVSK